MLIIDVDYFKSVNDTHGHVVGDEVLKGLARVLKSVFTRKTDIIARYGGEEFVVLLPDASAVDAIRLAHKFREALEEQVFEGNKKFRVTASIGVSNNGGREIGEDFIRVADDQLYVVKNGGRNNVAFDGGIVAASTGDTKDKIVVKLAKSASL